MVVGTLFTSPNLPEVQIDLYHAGDIAIWQQ